MSLFALMSILVVAAGLFSFVNYRFIGLPNTIGVMVMALGISLVLVAAGETASPMREWAIELIGKIDFNQVVLHGMLAFLLFAGALHLDLAEMAREKLTILLLAVFGTIVSTALVGLLAYAIFAAFNMDVPLLGCFLFGALISPTDPVAVLGILQRAGAPKGVEIQMAGESLFNDGIAVVAFLTILELASAARWPGVGGVSILLAREVGGGLALGLASGLFTYWLLKQVDQYQTEMLLTLGLAMGGYALADALHISAPITVVVAGLFIGNRGRAFAMSARTREHVDTFWELVDSILNAVLFLLIGLQMLVMPFDWRYLLAGGLAIPAVLLARLLSVAPIVGGLRLLMPRTKGTIRVLSWGGLRGGISVALALSLPQSHYHDLLLAVTYVVVVFSILVQGLTIGPLIRRIGIGHANRDHLPSTKDGFSTH